MNFTEYHNSNAWAIAFKEKHLAELNKYPDLMDRMKKHFEQLENAKNNMINECQKYFNCKTFEELLNL